MKATFSWLFKSYHGALSAETSTPVLIVLVALSKSNKVTLGQGGANENKEDHAARSLYTMRLSDISSMVTKRSGSQGRLGPSGSGEVIAY